MFVQFYVCLRINFFGNIYMSSLVSLRGLYDQSTNCENNHMLAWEQIFGWNRLECVHWDLFICCLFGSLLLLCLCVVCVPNIFFFLSFLWDCIVTFTISAVASFQLVGSKFSVSINAGCKAQSLKCHRCGESRGGKWFAGYFYQTSNWKGASSFFFEKWGQLSSVDPVTPSFRSAR